MLITLDELIISELKTSAFSLEEFLRDFIKENGLNLEEFKRCYILDIYDAPIAKHEFGDGTAKYSTSTNYHLRLKTSEELERDEHVNRRDEMGDHEGVSRG